MCVVVSAVLILSISISLHFIWFLKVLYLVNSRADLGGRGSWGAEASPPKFYHVLARKIVVQVQLHLNMKTWKECEEKS